MRGDVGQATHKGENESHLNLTAASLRASNVDGSAETQPWPKWAIAPQARATDFTGLLQVKRRRLLLRASSAVART